MTHGGQGKNAVEGGYNSGQLDAFSGQKDAYSQDQGTTTRTKESEPRGSGLEGGIRRAPRRGSGWRNSGSLVLLGREKYELGVTGKEWKKTTPERSHGTGRTEDAGAERRFSS